MLPSQPGNVIRRVLEFSQVGTDGGGYNLRCPAADAKIRRRQRRKIVKVLKALNDTSTDAGVTASTPVTGSPRRQEQILNAAFPNASSPERVHYKATIQCTVEMRKKLDPCYWSLATACKGQDYLVNALATSNPSDNQGLRIPTGDLWLNDTFPWIWLKHLSHYRYPKPRYNPLLSSMFPFRLSTAAVRLLRATQWQLVPHSSLMYVQKLPNRRAISPEFTPA